MNTETISAEELRLYLEMTMMAFNAPALPGVSSTGSLNMQAMNFRDSVDTMNTYAKH